MNLSIATIGGIYEMGAADDADVGAELGALIVTPAAMRAEMNTIEALVKQLDRDVQASTVGPEFKSAFASFRDEWRGFHKENEGWWDRMWGATYEKILDFRRRTEEWRRALLAQGGNTAIPSAAGGSNNAKPPMSNVHLWLIGSAIGAWALSSVANMRK